MNKFLRKNQKIFFIIISFVIILSFSFFGTYSALIENRENKKDKIIAVSIDNKNIFQSEIDMMDLLLSLDNKEKTFFVNELLKTGILKLIFEENFEEVSLGFEKKLEKLKSFTFFKHPYLPFSVKDILEKNNPNVLLLLEKLKEEEKFTTNTFDLFNDLYVEMKKIDFSSIQQKLFFMQKQYNLPMEPFNNRYFPFASIFEWFPKTFLDKISIFIINGSILAKRNKCIIKEIELQLDIENRFKTEDRKFFANKRIKNSLEKVLLFKKYLNISKNIFLDKTSNEDLLSFACDKVDIKLFSLPENFQMKTFYEFLQFLTYLKITKENIDLFSKERSFNEIEKEYPSFVKKKFSLFVKKVNVKDIFLKIGEKELWKWQVKDKNLNCLKKEFSFLIDEDLKKEEAKKFTLLEELSQKNRRLVDKFSRFKIIEKNPLLIKESLNEALYEKIDVNIAISNKDLFLKGVKNKCLITLLEKNKEDPLFIESEDKKNYYEIKVGKTEEFAKRSILSFEKALKDKLLEDVLEDILKEKYFNLSEKELLQIGKKEFLEKSYEEIKEKIAKIVFKDFFEKLDKEKNFLKENNQDICKKFFFIYMAQIKKNLEKDENYESFLKDKKNNWMIDIRNNSVDRFSCDQWMKEKVFEKENFIFSDLFIKDENILFLKKIRKSPLEKNISFRNLKKIKKVLENEAKLFLAKKVLENV